MVTYSWLYNDKKYHEQKQVWKVIDVLFDTSRHILNPLALTFLYVSKWDGVAIGYHSAENYQ